jgi:hypothetical protein
MDKVPVRFIKNFQVHYAGEIAGFYELVAQRLVDAGVAEFYVEEKSYKEPVLERVAVTKAEMPKPKRKRGRPKKKLALEE